MGRFILLNIYVYQKVCKKAFQDLCSSCKRKKNVILITDPFKPAVVAEWSKALSQIQVETLGPRFKSPLRITWEEEPN